MVMVMVMVMLFIRLIAILHLGWSRLGLRSGCRSGGDGFRSLLLVMLASLLVASHPGY